MRVALFFDGNNFYRSKDVYAEHLVLNYDNLAEWVCKKVGGPQASFVGAHYFTGVGEQGGLQKFLEGLEVRRGFFVHRAPVVSRTMVCTDCGAAHSIPVEKRVDTKLVAEMVRMAALDHYDRAVVFSGDEDIVPALDTVASFGKQVFVGTWGGHALAHELRVRSYGVIDLIEGLEYFHIEPNEHEAMRCTGLQLDHLFSQLQEAFAYFHGKNGHVSRWYFENKWKPNGPCPPPGTGRQELLDALIQRGKVEVFEVSVNGRRILALRPKKKLV